MIKILGNGWAELEFPFHDAVNSGTWRTFGRVVRDEEEKVMIEYYNYENKLVTQIFKK